MPILEELQAKARLKCHVLQFSWAKEEKVNQLSLLSESMGIRYNHFPVSKAIHPLMGTAFTVYRGKQFIRRYLKRHKIDIVMPRSTMPALMVNGLMSKWKNKKYKVVFDADGLPLEERLDFTELKVSDYQYKFLKAAETKMLLNADIILARTQKAINHHLGRIGESHRSKFHVVRNGRRAEQFRFSNEDRIRVREELGLSENDMLWVYAGTLGPQYVLKEMLEMFDKHLHLSQSSKFLVLSANGNYLQQHLPAHLRDKVVHKTPSFASIPSYLSAADIAFALRQPAWSMRGVSPIKLGEYLLMGLPVIASKGVGDTENILLGKPFVNLYEHNDPQRREKAVSWANGLAKIERTAIREFALQHFTLEKCVEDYLTAFGEV